MKKMTKRIISMLLTVCLCFLATVPVFAADEDEEYLADLRIIYAEDATEALEILDDSDLEGYKLFDANLNENTGKSGVYLAYLTTTDIEEAITDISVMQMNGGYNEGNYQEMIQQSLAEYEAMGANYLTAIDYFKKGYNAGNYLSDLAFRQLNFYNVVTEGIDDIPDFEGERLGDIFLEGIEVSDLATMFMQGNSYALSNIRSLLAMGVSYNEDGKTYLEHVSIEAEKYTANPHIYDNNDYNEIAPMVAATITVFHDMFKELEAYEPELNYEDENMTNIEFKYLSSKSLAEMMRNVKYLGGKTLYEFFMNYTVNKDDYSELYPLVAALNEGQLAMTKVAHYYDVVRYSVILDQNGDIDAELAKMEEKYSQNPFNVYTGVDRTIYRDTFALTSEAYRADAFTESGLSALLFKSGAYTSPLIMGAVGSAIALAGLGTHIYSYVTTPQAVFDQYNSILAYTKTEFGKYGVISAGPYKGLNAETAMNRLFKEVITDENVIRQANSQAWGFQRKFDYIAEHKILTDNSRIIEGWNQINVDFGTYSQKSDMMNDATKYINKIIDRAEAIKSAAYSMYLIGGVMMLSYAIVLGVGIYEYYHPTYDDIPTAMVDLINTVDGDRYIKYDVVYEAEPQSDGTFIAGDLNAFSANRWNAMYYTKSYEAGKPLLADEFVVSSTNNTPAKKHAAVHRFGEVVCYNLNKYNFNDDYSIYLSVKQSDNQKSAVADVPEIIGSVFSVGYIFLAGGVGIAAGVGGTFGTMEIIKRRKNKTNAEVESTEEVTE